MKTYTILVALVFIGLISLTINAQEQKPKEPTLAELKATVAELKSQLADEEVAYDDLQQRFLECQANQDSQKDGSVEKPTTPDTNEKNYQQLAPTDNIGTAGMTPIEYSHKLHSSIGAMRLRLADYKDASDYLNQNYKNCKDGKPLNAPVCWGFWPHEDGAKLHWKAMPCDGA